MKKPEGRECYHRIFYDHQGQEIQGSTKWYCSAYAPWFRNGLYWQRPEDEIEDVLDAQIRTLLNVYDFNEVFYALSRVYQDEFEDVTKEQKLCYKENSSTLDQKCGEFVKPEIIEHMDVNSIRPDMKTFDVRNYPFSLYRLLKIYELFAGLEKLRFQLQGDWKPGFDDRNFYTISMDYLQNIQAQWTLWKPRTYYYTSIFGMWEKEEYCQKAIELFGDQIKEVLSCQ